MSDHDTGHPGHGRFSRSGVNVAVGLLLCLVSVAGWLAWHRWRQPEVTSAMRGEVIAQRLGCLSCHGSGGLGGTPDPLLDARAIPGWTGGEVQMYARSDQDIREWILYGEPRHLPATLGLNRVKGLIPMPAYADVVTPGELDDLLAYFRAVSGWGPEMPEAAYEGRAIAERLGCFGCHGPSGMGGVGNPDSLTGHIPAWDGREFGELVRDDAELREWILDGRISRLWDDPVARQFLEGQIIEMPAYRDFVSDSDLDTLVGYVRWLRGE